MSKGVMKLSLTATFQWRPFGKSENEAPKTMSLTNIAARGAKARDKACKLSDATGLYLLVNPNGSKHCSTARDSGRTPTTGPRRLLVGL